MPGTGLLFVGRFVPKKGLADLIAALALLFREKETDARLTIAGDGPDAAALRARAEALGVAARISWLGVVPREHLRTQLRQHTCLVVPSTVAPDGDRDGIPNVVLEAMAVGTPVVGTDAGSLPEVLSPETGWVCEPQNPAALAALIRSCSGNSAERARRGARARQQIETRFDAVALARQRAALFGVCPDA